MRGIALIALMTTALTAPASSEVTAIRAGHLVNPADGSIRSDVTILVEDGRIVAVGPEVPTPEAAEVLDLGNDFVLPGLIDAHTHLCEMIPVESRVGGSFTLHLVRNTTADRVLQGVANARRHPRA